MSESNIPVWGPHNPHPLSKIKTELIWEGKYDEFGNRRPLRLPTSPYPLQLIETIDEPLDRARGQQPGLFDAEAFGEKAHRDDFRNRLIWGDNKLVMHTLLEEFRGKIDLIYIDPPFDVGADFTMNLQIGDENEIIEKDQSVLEAVAYRDTWGKGTDSYIQMIFERLLLIKELLAEKGTCYVHCDKRANSYLRIVLEEIFNKENYRNEIIWCYKGPSRVNSDFPDKHDTILRFSKSEKVIFDINEIKVPYSKSFLSRRKYSEGSGGIMGRKEYDLDRSILKYEMGKTPEDWWDDIPSGGQISRNELLGFETQKPEKLLERIIGSSSDGGSIVADFFCGSGTTLAVAEKFGRKWIGVDLGRYAIHTTRKRLIQVQRELHDSNQPYRSFDIYNLGRYERQWWQMERLKGADEEHRKTVLKFYKAAAVSSPSSPLIHGTKHGVLIHVDQIDSVFTKNELQLVAEAAAAAGAKELHILAWEFEMELALQKQAIEAATGLDIRLKYIPREIMEANRTEVQFFEAGILNAELVIKDDKVDVKLTHFAPSLAEAPEKELTALRERAVTSPFDFIDFWAVDFEWREGKPFEHHWQDFRTRKDRSLKTQSDFEKVYKEKGEHLICVKVIDVFGIDTTTVIQYKG